MNKRTIRVLFIAYSEECWMGGIYYVKNIAYQFLEYAKSQNHINYVVYILLDRSVSDVFEFCKDYINVRLIVKKRLPWDNGSGFVARNIRELIWIIRIYGHRIDYIFPSFSTRSIYRKKIISWIPDFQHVAYPEFFTDEEKEFRDEYFKDIAQNHSKLVLSSQDAFDTYKKLYPNNCNNVGVVNFVSAIFTKDINQDLPELLLKYHIQGNKYFIVSNQFYRHKNHIVLFDAIRLLRDEGYSEVKLICTGMPYDVKDSSYYEEIEDFLTCNSLMDNITILGLIPRRDQLTLMNGAIAVVQPSLFEGWGTCTEDAKTLGKIVVLSDIPVHREQSYEKTILFEKKNVEELAGILKKIWDEYRDKDIDSHFEIKNAVKYGQQFAKLLND